MKFPSNKMNLEDSLMQYINKLKEQIVFIQSAIKMSHKYQHNEPYVFMQTRTIEVLNTVIQELEELLPQNYNCEE